MKQQPSEASARIFRTPLGWAGVAASDAGITRVILPKADRKSVERELKRVECRAASGKGVKGRSELLNQAVNLLERFFAGEDVLFDLPLDLRYYTPFQQRVWNTCAAIPYGKTRSYQWIAERIKRPKAARAVGQAMGANPVPVVVPCHRVVTAAGRLGGFSGGLGLKKKLLGLEERKSGR